MFSPRTILTAPKRHTPVTMPPTRPWSPGSTKCNAPRPLRQVSSSYSLLLPYHLFACHAFHIMSSCASHLHTCSSRASEHFPRCLFCFPALLCPSASPFASFCVRVLNILGMDRGLPSGLGIAPIDRLSSFVPFGVRLILQRLTGVP